MTDVLEAAVTNRARCRGCGLAIQKGTLRFGERVPNPYGEGEDETTYWFHVPCAARRRPERFAALDAAALAPLPDGPALQALAQRGATHHRLARIAGVERARSGRAKCRHCKEAIAAGTRRIVLTIWQQARFVPMGFVHSACAAAYFGTAAIEPWLDAVTAPDPPRPALPP
ncbi:MAG: hypothetical protein HY903_09255 [Deltaproteobacteria bacterium]|nr:hypothetical protein [Deltaproteobacteria bacterium]